MSNLALVKKDTVDVVAAKVKEFQESGELRFPPSYIPENAMKSAWLILQGVKDKNKQPALDVCTKDSIANSLLDMVVQGLSPAKKQCYFTVYGNQLQLTRSYFGTLAVTKRLSEIKDISYQVIYESDEVEIFIENGKKSIQKHATRLENIDIRKIVGAYAVIEKTNGEMYTEIMNISQIKQAWQQGKFTEKMNPIDANGNIKADTVHFKYTDQMVLKTVINRACKNFANTSDDSDLLIDAFNRSTENEYKQPAVTTDEEVAAEIEEKANKETLDFEEPQQPVDVEYKEIKSEQPIQEQNKTEGPGF